MVRDSQCVMTVNVTRKYPSGNYDVNLGGVKYFRSNADDVLRELSRLRSVHVDFKDEFENKK